LTRQSFALHFDGDARRYTVHLPAQCDGTALPLLLILHGTGATPEWTLAETRWDKAADARGFLAVLPEGTRADPGSPPDFLRNPPAWNSGGPRGPFGLPDADDVGFLNAVLDDAARRFPVDPHRVYATGFSNGAGMVFRLAAASSERFAAVAPVAGLCPFDPPRLAAPMPTLYIIGTRDPLVPQEGGDVVLPWGGMVMRRPPVTDTLRRWAAALGCPGEPSLVREDGGVREMLYGPAPGGAEVRAFYVEGLGHHWPGGRGQLKKRLAGPPSDRLDANAVIWDYFARHRRA
jgi:polyhydroxybutyrate depolymerase